VRERPAHHRPAAGNPGGDEAAPHRDQRRHPEQRDPDRVQGRLTGHTDGPDRSEPRGVQPRAALSQLVATMEATMRPTTALDDNVFDFDYLLHPGTKFDHPMDVVSHSGLTLAEKRAILASWASDASAIAS